ncbi:U-box domain-containing protein, partial [Acrasis kona]
HSYFKEDAKNLTQDQLHELIQSFSKSRSIKERITSLTQDVKETSKWKSQKFNEKQASLLTKIQNNAIKLHKELSQAKSSLMELPIDNDRSHQHQGILLNDPSLQLDADQSSFLNVSINIELHTTIMT